MSRPTPLALLSLAFVAALAIPAIAAPKADPLQAQAQAVFKPLPAAAKADAAQVALGKQLFFEPRLSANGAISCNSCHNLNTFGSDNQPTSTGHKGQKGGRNSPTVLNAGLHVAQFWDGRAATLADQAKGPILNPVEMALPNAKVAVDRIKAVPGYQAAFKKAFPGQKDPVTFDNIAGAIASFESTLVTPSRFDQYLQGNANALNAKEKAGLKTFMGKGCVSCHSGATVGGSMYMKFGVVSPYANQKDLGRFELTKNPADKYVFKVPSLRNIAKTHPYFHDGKVAKLEEAVKVMAKTQLGATLTPGETSEVVAFLGSLTGELPAQVRKLPQLPKK